MTITQAVERQFTLMRRATAGGREIRLASLLGAVVGPARRGVLPPFLCSRSQPHGQQVGGRRVGCAASGRPVRSPPTWPNSRGLRRPAESGGRFPRSLPPWIRHDRDVNGPEPGLPLIGCVTRGTRSRCMAGHRTPVPRIQSEPRAARPSAAASVLSLDFGSHHMEDDNLKSELERLRTVVDIRLPTAPRRNPFSTVSRACQTAR